MRLKTRKRFVLLIPLLSYPAVTDAASPPMQAQNCTFNLDALPVFTGRISAIYPSAWGQVGNVILSDGREVVMPDGFPSKDVGISAGARISVKGLVTRHGDLIAAEAVIDREQLTCGTPSLPRLASHPFGAASGRVTHVLHQKQGLTNGLALDNGVTLRFSPVAQGASAVTLGEAVQATGSFFTTPYGNVMIVSNMTRDGQKVATRPELDAPRTGAAPGSPDYDQIRQWSGSGANPQE